MSKNIAISDEVYRKLKREKGERSFSEVIEERLTAGGRLVDVMGQQILSDETYEAVRDDIETMSEGTLERLENEGR